MSNEILSNDSTLRFPHSTLLKASAGSGKTHALTERFVQFLLSNTVRPHHLRNILAITFSNNAAKEMKERTLSWLKEVSFGETDKLHQLSQILSLDEEQLIKRSESLIDEILLNYTDFQVKTIDSFMTSIYKASAIDLGYDPGFDILMAPDSVMAYAFNRFLRRVSAGTAEADFLDQLLQCIAEGRGAETSYLWDPSRALLEEINELYKKLPGIANLKDISAEEHIPDDISSEIARTAQELNRTINQSGLKKSEKSTFERILKITKVKSYPDLIGIGLKSPPVLKPKDAETHVTYRHILELWNILGDLIRQYTRIYASRYYIPYIKAYKAFNHVLEKAKREQGVVFIDDINKKLFHYLDQEIIPDVYFRLGEIVFHYLIDEFQDTSPIQWKNLYRLIENSIAQGGSFFAVGDTKQAIYGFRNADYQIMRQYESDIPFPSAHHEVKELTINHRSYERIVKFNEEFFQNIVANRDLYHDAADRSGLTHYVQDVKMGHEGLGYVEVNRYEKADEEPTEKIGLQRIMQELKERGYGYSDIAILTQRNEDVANITTWLSEIKVPFISYSSLDIRRRKLTEEILFLLTFLDAPQDNLSFAGFLLGDIFRTTHYQGKSSLQVERLHEFIFRNRKSTSPLYKLFQEEFPGLWGNYFEKLFRASGYLPLYDLASEIYRIFKVFENFAEEEATLVKILEAIKNLEKEGMNNPGAFRRLADDEIIGDTDWNIDVPEGIDAVKVMTIHKAKGLGFPVVIVMLYGEQSRGFKYILDEREEVIRLLRINREIAKTSEFFERLYEEERMKEMVNRLNTLYVAFTRPACELYVLGVSGKKQQFPIDLLEEARHVYGEKCAPARGSQTIHQTLLPLSHPTDQADFSTFSSLEALNIAERSRGEFIHRVLSFIEYGDEDLESRLEELVRQIQNEQNIGYPVDTITRELLAFLLKKEVRPYFIPIPGRLIRREQEFSDEKGNLLRMDRVIIDKDRVMVMDYKTGGKNKVEEKYISQMKSYMSIVKDLYPDKKIEGIIAYIDLKETVTIE